MQSLTRRLFMRRAAAALPAVAVGTAATAAPDAAPEHPAILSIGARIDCLAEQFNAAVKARNEARALAERLCPPVPDEIRLTGGRTTISDCASWLTDVEDNYLEPETFEDENGRKRVRQPVRIYNSTLLKQRLEDMPELFAPPRSARGRHIRELIRLSHKYEKERAAAIKKSGLSEAKEQLWSAAFAMQELTREAKRIVPSTPVGIAIIAKLTLAATACEGDPPDSGFRGHTAQRLAPVLSQGILGLAAAVQS